MNRRWLIGLGVHVVLLSNCNQTLTPARAVNLVEQQLTDRQLVVQLTKIDALPFNVPSFDARSEDAVLQRMLAAGLVTRQEESRSVPDIAGSYSSTYPPIAHGDVLRLEQHGAVLTGELNSRDLLGPCVLTGRLETDGSATTSCTAPPAFAYLTPYVRRLRLRSVARGDRTELEAFGYNARDDAYSTTPVWRYERAGTPEMLTVPMYTLRESPSLAPLRARGGYRVGEIGRLSVERLLLDSDVAASATVVQELILNALGAAMIGQTRTTCEQRATFRKEPTGTWVLGDWRPCQLYVPNS